MSCQSILCDWAESQKNQKVLFRETLLSSNLHARSGHWQGLCDQPTSPWDSRKLEKMRQDFSHVACPCPAVLLPLYPQDCSTLQAQLQVVEMTPKWGSDLRNLEGLSALKFSQQTSTSYQHLSNWPYYTRHLKSPMTPALSCFILPKPFPSFLGPPSGLFCLCLQSLGPDHQPLTPGPWTSLSLFYLSTCLPHLTQSHRPPHRSQDDLPKNDPVILPVGESVPSPLFSPFKSSLIVEVPDQMLPFRWRLYSFSKHLSST